MLKNYIYSKREYRFFFLLIIVPSLIVTMSLILVISINFFHNKKQFQNSALSSLNQIASLNEEKLSTLIKQASFLYNEREIMQYTDSATTISGKDIEAVSSRLNALTESSSFVNSIYLLDTDNDIVVMNNSKYPLDIFFRESMVYNSYSYSYWKSFDFYSYANNRILMPTTLSYNGEESNVIPIVLRSSYSNRTKSYIVMNVNISSFTKTTGASSLTSNSHMYILNNYTRSVFSLDSDETFVLGSDDELYKKLVGSKQMFDLKSNPYGSVTAIKYSTSNSFIGYTYYALIPISDIFASLASLLLYSTCITLVFVFLAIFAALKNTDKIIYPFRKVSDIIMPNEELDIKNLEQKALQLKASNINLTNILPYAQERYLVNYLNSTEYSIDEHTRDIIKQTLPFKHDYFAVVVVQLSPTSGLYDEYTSAEYMNIESGFYNIVKDMFAAEFDSLVLSSERETLYIVLNAEFSDNDSKIQNIISTLCGYLRNDMDVINFSTGTSRFYADLSGLKQAHKEALSNLKLAEKPSDKISFNTIEQNGITFTLKDADETEFYNALISTKTDKAFEILKKIEDANNDISLRSRKQLYTQILSIILRAMRTRKITFDDNKTDFEIFNSALSAPIEDVRSEILLIMEKIRNSDLNSDTTNLSAAIVRYIEENHSNPDISLDHIANVFGTNSSYVSSVVSSALNIGFHEYVTKLRISNAKHLLTQTDDNIQDIYTQCGFLSQQTFYRTFKKQTGMTPNSYRKLADKK